MKSIFYIFLALILFSVSNAQNVSLNWNNDYNTSWYLCFEIDNEINCLDMDTSTSYQFDLADSVQAKVWVISYPDSILSDTIEINYPRQFPEMEYIFRCDTLLCWIKSALDGAYLVCAGDAGIIYNNPLNAGIWNKFHLSEADSVIYLSLSHENNTQGYSFKRLKKVSKLKMFKE